MLLAPGVRLGPYEILAPIGKGGMGEVYRAHDPRLNRDVAIKVSTIRFTERFTREARAIAALNHTNICHLYDVGPDYLVMEFVEGHDLRDPLDFDDALPIIHQLINGIEAAHEKNIIHRDLKPANVKVTPEGVVKILDFGLAKAMEPTPGNNSNPEDSPTDTLGATQPGAIIGTVAYMAPEQAQGKPVDKRADIWAFGVVVYELLTGQRLFQGDTVTDTLAAVMTKAPDWDRVPAPVRPMLRRCLVRDPRARLRDIGDAMPLLEATDASVPRAAFLPWAIAGGLAVLLTLAVWTVLRGPAREPRPVSRWTVDLPDTIPLNGAGIALSRDGTRLAYSEGTGILGVPTNTGSLPRLWLRRVDQFDASPIAGTVTSLRPQFSPDGEWIAYFTGTSAGALRKVSVAGGKPVTLCEEAPFAGASWGDDNTIVFSGLGGLMRVAASGGKCEALTKANSDTASHRWPQFLPGSRRLFLPSARRGPSTVRRFPYSTSERASIA